MDQVMASGGFMRPGHTGPGKYGTGRGDATTTRPTSAEVFAAGSNSE